MPPKNRPPSANSSPLGPEKSGDPLTGNLPGLSTGSTWTEPPRSVRERARIVSVDANRRAYRVITLSGRYFTVLRIQNSSTDFDLLPIGTDVRIDWSLGAPYIDGILPSEGNTPNEYVEKDNPTGTKGFIVNDPVLNQNLGANSRDNDTPTDILPGDFVRRGADGATIGAYHGKVAQVFGGHLAQILAFGEQDKIEIISGLFRLITWMGESKVINENGRTSFVWKGGANQLSETGADEEKYTIHLDVGATGNLINFRITTIDQQNLFQFHVTKDGRMEVFSIAGFDTQIGDRDKAGHLTQIDGNVTQHIEGNLTETITGSHTYSVDGDIKNEYSNNLDYKIGNDFIVKVNKNTAINTGGNKSERIVGDDQKTVGGKETTAIEGDSEDTIKGHKNLHVDGEISVKSNNDKIKLTCQSADLEIDAGGNVIKMTCQNAQIGGEGDNAVLYNITQSILNNLITTTMTHTHDVAVSGTTGIAAPSTGLIAGLTPLTGQLSQMQSQKLKLGG